MAAVFLINMQNTLFLFVNQKDVELHVFYTESAMAHMNGISVTNLSPIRQTIKNRKCVEKTVFPC